MSKLKLGPLEDDKSVKVTVELPATVHRDLLAYADALGRETGKTVGDPVRLITPMIERFMSTDRGFAKMRREKPSKGSSAVLPKLPKQAT